MTSAGAIRPPTAADFRDGRRASDGGLVAAALDASCQGLLSGGRAGGVPELHGALRCRYREPVPRADRARLQQQLLQHRLLLQQRRLALQKQVRVSQFLTIIKILFRN